MKDKIGTIFSILFLVGMLTLHIVQYAQAHSGCDGAVVDRFGWPMWVCVKTDQ